MKKAAFSLLDYQFKKVKIDLTKRKSNNLDLNFSPNGKYHTEKSRFELKFVFSSISEGAEDKFIEIECIGVFQFVEGTKFEDIPSYFYMNSIAILFPYVRAFISNVTLQTNTAPIVLPTMNLSSLENPLKENTIQVK